MAASLELAAFNLASSASCIGMKLTLKGTFEAPCTEERVIVCST
jgi:hypothetical protein